MIDSIAISLDEMTREPARYVREASGGVEITVLLNGEPVARIVPPLPGPGSDVHPLVREARALRAAVRPGESSSELLAEARRESGRG